MIDSDDLTRAKSTPHTVDECIIPTERHAVFKAVRRRIEGKYGVQLHKKSNRKIREIGNYSVSIVGPADCTRNARDELLRFIYPLHEHLYSYSLQLQSLIDKPGYIDQLEADFDCSILKEPDLCVLKLFGSEEALLTVVSALDSVIQTDYNADAVGEDVSPRLSTEDNNAFSVEAIDAFGQRREKQPDAEAKIGSSSLTELDEELRRMCAIHGEEYEDYVGASISIKQEMLRWLSGLPVSQGDEQELANSFSVSTDDRVAGQLSLLKLPENVYGKKQAADINASGDGDTLSDRNNSSAKSGGQDGIDEIFATVKCSLDEEAANPSLTNDQLLQRNLQRGRLFEEALAASKPDTTSMPTKLNAEQQKTSLQPATGLRDTPISVVAQPLRLPSEPARDELRAVIIDGNNVAREHGRVAKVYSSRGIRLAVEYFRNRGHRDIVVYVPQWRPFGNRAVPPTVDGHLLVELHDEGLLEYTPSRKNPITGRIEASYDDWYIVNAAHLKDGVMVSNDQFRDVINDHPEFKYTVAERSLPFNFLGDNFIVPPDPHGRNGPSLNQLLRKSAPSHAGPTAIASTSTSQQVDLYRYHASNAGMSSTASGKLRRLFPVTSGMNDNNKWPGVAATNNAHFPPVSNQQAVYSNPSTNPRWVTLVGYTPLVQDGFSAASAAADGTPLSPQKKSKKLKENRKSNTNIALAPEQQLNQNGHHGKYDVDRGDIAVDSDEERTLIEKVCELSAVKV